MCGILGQFETAATTGRSAGEHAKRALAALRHRGPDDQGLEIYPVGAGRLTLGHARLSIIDLSPGGHQPQHSSDGRYAIVFNGEIYNYRELRAELLGKGHAFRTDSDTEVLLAAWQHWGEASLARLVGMFAFVVYDRVDGSLTLVRDAFGIKPLYYHLSDDAFSFASELPALKALVRTPLMLDAQRAYDYLVFGDYDATPGTFFAGVQQLPPGHIVRLALAHGGLSDTRRWWWPSIEERSRVSFADAADTLREMFLDSIRLHLRSDVPLGAALSGGVDSSAVVCAMRQVEPEVPINTFSFIAPGTAIDEERWADVVNRHVGAIPHKVHVSPAELAADLDDMIRAQGEPFGGTSIYAQYRVFRLARERGVVVTLDGQGADELLAGYTGYPDAFVRSLMERGRGRRVPAFLRDWARWPGRGAKRAGLVLGASLTPKWLRGAARRIAGQDATPDWVSEPWLYAQDVVPAFPERAIPSQEGRGRRLVERLRTALTGSGLAALLRHGDRNSMRWSIESRVPFLTPAIAEFLLGLPEEYLLSMHGETKTVFRAAMRGLVPDQILDRREKIGFQTPEQEWLRLLRRDVSGWLEAADGLPLLHADRARHMVDEVFDGRRPFSAVVWRLMNYCRWAQLQ